MRIVCPICSAAYNVDDALLIPGRSVRCARCGEQWVAVPLTPPEVVAEPEPEPEAEPEPAAEPEAPVVRPRREALAATTAPSALTAMERLASRPATLRQPSPWLPTGWLVSVALLVLLGFGLVFWRAEMMQAWPPSGRLYDWLGLLSTPAAPPAR
ncbi:MAG TPA: zinc-ribbon domain-containing protein [Acetobacteraceae bacterium]|nr:zinc-ribbon domain-containing protein [Acetobacteraceae bacterium]